MDNNLDSFRNNDVYNRALFEIANLGLHDKLIFHIKYRDTLIRMFNKRGLFPDTRPVNVLCNINALFAIDHSFPKKRQSLVCSLYTKMCVAT
jgi:hypothetical protein